MEAKQIKDADLQHRRPKKTRTTQNRHRNLNEGHDEEVHDRMINEGEKQAINYSRWHLMRFTEHGPRHKPYCSPIIFNLRPP